MEPHSLLFLGLSYLPTWIPASKLKKLKAENCAIKKIHESLIHVGMEINLKNNQISELPREETREFLERGGQFDGGIDFKENPLAYPPQHAYNEGTEKVVQYLRNYPNSMVDPNDITIILIGNKEAGKTSLGLTLSGKISNASEVKAKDRTQAFDVHQTLLEGIKINLIDLGGHEEYESCLEWSGQHPTCGKRSHWS